MLVCFYFINSDEPIFFKKKQQSLEKETEKVVTDEDGTIIIEHSKPQTESKQKYRVKKKLKILVATLIVLLLISIALNFYLIYEPDKYVYCTSSPYYYHNEYCSSVNHWNRLVPKSIAIESGYDPCPKCKP